MKSIANLYTAFLPKQAKQYKEQKNVLQYCYQISNYNDTRFSKNHIFSYLFNIFSYFSDPNLPHPGVEPKSKKRKADTENQTVVPYLTVEKLELKNIQSNFMICMNCWDLLNSSENLKRGTNAFIPLMMFNCKHFYYRENLT